MKLSTSRVSTTVLALVNAIYAVLLVFSVLAWTDVQKGAVLVAANATAGFGLAVFAHFRPATVEEPVALGVTFLAFTSSTLGLAVVFAWFDITEAQAGALQALIIVVLGIPTAVLVRRSVTSPASLAIAEAAAVTPDALEAGIIARHGAPPA